MFFPNILSTFSIDFCLQNVDIRSKCQNSAARQIERNASGWGDTEHSWAASRHPAHSEGAGELLERTKQHDTGKSAAPLEPRLLGWARAGPWLAGGGHVTRCWAVIGPAAGRTHWSVRREGRWAGGAAWPVPSPCSRDQLQGDTPGLHKHFKYRHFRFQDFKSIKTSILLPFSRFWPRNLI